MDAPQISSQGTKFANVDITPVAFADPEKFPHGLEVLIMMPGAMEPLGRCPIPKGFALALIAPEGARYLVSQMRVLRRSLPGGTVMPPGI